LADGANRRLAQGGNERRVLSRLDAFWQKDVYQLFFAAASSALSDTLADPKWLRATVSGFTMILPTWNQHLHSHPPIGAELEAGVRRQPRATNQGTILRMIHLRFITQKRAGIFQYH
jgi:hypothetical protein